MSVADLRPGPDGHARAVLRGAAQRDAAQLVEARDLLVVRVCDLDDATLVEGLVCGEHWTSGLRLDLRHEPLLLQALTSGRLVRCCPRRPRRICGPFWSTAAVLVPRRLTARETVVVVLGGVDVQPSAERAGEAAAAAVALLEAEAAPESVADDAPDGWGVVVVRLSDAAPDAAALAKALDAVRDAAGDAPRVLRSDARELCALLPAGGAVACERVAQQVRADAAGPGLGVGWALGAPGRSVTWALEVARAMAQHDERAVARRGDR
jgi:hypothetical protein